MANDTTDIPEHTADGISRRFLEELYNPSRNLKKKQHLQLRNLMEQMP